MKNYLLLRKTEKSLQVQCRLDCEISMYRVMVDEEIDKWVVVFLLRSKQTLLGLK
jgi:hypothetical protein